MGPGSQTMVALLASGGASNPFGGWAVFRLAGGTWQLVMEHAGGGRITAAGPDIRETVSVMREGDSHCCPTGGTKARLWHWNGTRFTAGPWKQVTPGAAAPSRGVQAALQDAVRQHRLRLRIRHEMPRAFVSAGSRAGSSRRRPARPGCSRATGRPRCDRPRRRPDVRSVRRARGRRRGVRLESVARGARLRQDVERRWSELRIGGHRADLSQQGRSRFLPEP